MECLDDRSSDRLLGRAAISSATRRARFSSVTTPRGLPTSAWISCLAYKIILYVIAHNSLYARFGLDRFQTCVCRRRHAARQAVLVWPRRRSPYCRATREPYGGGDGSALVSRTARGVGRCRSWIALQWRNLPIARDLPPWVRERRFFADLNRRDGSGSLSDRRPRRRRCWRGRPSSPGAGRTKTACWLEPSCRR